MTRKLHVFTPGFAVLDRKVSVNQEIGSSNQGHLFALASDLRRMRVTAEVGEGDIDKVRRGMAARFSVGNAGEDAPNGVSGAVGVFFGYYPAWKASRREPIEALRHE